MEVNSVFQDFKAKFPLNRNQLLKFTTVANVRKNCSFDRKKLLKFEAEGREFANILRSLEQFNQTAKGQKKFW